MKLQELEVIKSNNRIKEKDIQARNLQKKANNLENRIRNLKNWVLLIDSSIEAASYTKDIDSDKFREKVGIIFGIKDAKKKIIQIKNRCWISSPAEDEAPTPATYVKEKRSQKKHNEFQKDLIAVEKFFEIDIPKEFLDKLIDKYTNKLQPFEQIEKLKRTQYDNNEIARLNNMLSLVKLLSSLNEGTSDEEKAKLTRKIAEISNIRNKLRDLNIELKGLKNRES